MFGERFYVGRDIPDCFNINSLYTVHYYENYEDYAFKGESHNFWEINLLDAGCIQITSWKKLHKYKFSLQQGSLVLIPPEEYHKYRISKGVHFSLFVISFSCDSPMMQFFYNHRKFDFSPLFSSLTGMILKEARQALVLPLSEITSDQMHLKSDAPYGALTMIKILLQQLLILLYREKTSPSHKYTAVSAAASKDTYVEKALALIQNNYLQNLSLQQICSEVGMSKAQLQRAFHNQLGKSVMQYVRIQRIEYAKYLIRLKQSSLGEIAEQLHFSSIYHFSSCFKSVTGISPSIYLRTLAAQCPDPEK